MLDKKLYNYKRGLEETNSFHSIGRFALPKPIEYSLVGYTGFVFLLEMIIWVRLLHFIPIGWAGALSVLGAYQSGRYLSELKIEGKKVHRFCKDKLFYHIKYGRKKDKYCLNKGKLYKKGAI